MKVNAGESSSARHSTLYSWCLGNIPEPFLNASITKPANNDDDCRDSENLSFSRAYTLALSPQIIYSRSKLLAQLVSSKVYRQLEFQAVGNWWIYEGAADINKTESGAVGRLKRIPNGREDVFSDNSIDVRAKRNLMKFLKFVADYENHTEVWQSHSEESLPVFLSTIFSLPPPLQITIFALTLSLKSPTETTVRYSLPRIARHLTSMGVFGPGFAAVIPKWGGSSEIAQVACRAGAVGGGVYILGTGVRVSSSVAFAVEHSDGREAHSDAWRNHVYRREPRDDSPRDPAWDNPLSIPAFPHPHLQITLTNDEVIRTKALIESRDLDSELEGAHLNNVSKMIAVVSSDLASLFTTTVEGGTTAAVSVVAFPSNSIKVDDQVQPHPVYIMVHSSDTGECPIGQCESESIPSFSSIHDDSL
jgi:Rab proteins geranylgeranyltransferase component A